MSAIDSGIATLWNAGLAEGVLGLWMNAWLLSWLLAFPAVLVVAPITRQLVARVVKRPEVRA